MNQYLKNLNKIEFVVTYACTGRCKHCSEGEHTSCGERIDPLIAVDAIRKIATAYDIRTVMAFGGEPLLYPEVVYAIMQTAKELDIPKRRSSPMAIFHEKRIKCTALFGALCIMQ